MTDMPLRPGIFFTAAMAVTVIHVAGFMDCSQLLIKNRSPIGSVHMIASKATKKLTTISAMHGCGRDSTCVHVIEQQLQNYVLISVWFHYFHS